MKSRRRSRGDILPQSNVLCVFQPASGPQISGVGECSDKFSGKLEEMHDVVGNMMSEFNPCDHWKLLGTLKPLDAFPSGSVGYPGGVFSFNNGGPFPTDLAQVLHDYDFLGPAYLDECAVNAELHFKTLVKDSVLLVNFILEFVELLEGNIRALKHLGTVLKKAFETYWRVLQSTGSHWVAWNFAIKPTLSDVKKMRDMLKSAQKRLKFLINHNRRPTKIKYRRSPVEFSISSLVITDKGWWEGKFDSEEGPIDVLPVDWGGFTADVVGTSQFSSWAMVQWDLPSWILDLDLGVAIGMMLAVMNGLYNPVKIVWEAIPFSWLVEWLTSKRAMLFKELSSLSPFPDATILEVGHSIKTKILIGEAFAEKVDLPDEGSSAARLPVGNFQWESYVRRQGLPNGNPALVSGGIDLRQTSILGGIAANWRQRR